MCDDAHEALALAAGIVCENTVQLPPDAQGRESDFIVPRLDMLELIKAQQAIYAARKALREARRQREIDDAPQLTLVA